MYRSSRKSVCPLMQNLILLLAKEQHADDHNGVVRSRRPQAHTKTVSRRYSEPITIAEERRRAQEFYYEALQYQFSEERS